jgi:hypothetical protein
VIDPDAVTALEVFVEEVPELGRKWREHLTEWGEPLPHLFFADVARFAVTVAESRSHDLRARFANAIEQFAASDNPDLVNLIHVSFAEHLVWGDAREQRALESLKELFGPATLQRIREFEDWAAGAEKWSRTHGAKEST